MNKKDYINKSLDFLRKNRLAVLSTFSWDGNYPESAMVYYLIDESSNILLLTTKGSRKIKNIEKDSKVAVLVGQEVEPIVVQIQGTTQVIEDANIVSKMFSPYLEAANKNPKSLGFPPLTQLSGGKGVVALKIKIDKLKYSDFRGKKPVIFEGSM